MLKSLPRLLFPLFMTAFFIMPVNVVAFDNKLSPTPQTAPLPQTKYPYRQPPSNFKPNIIKPPAPNFQLDLSPRINHETWCTQRYTSYRRTDNTYQLPSGGRVRCISPTQ